MGTLVPYGPIDLLLGEPVTFRRSAPLKSAPLKLAPLRSTCKPRHKVRVNSNLVARFGRGFSRLGDLQDLEAPNLSSGGEHSQRDGNAATPHDHAGPQGACPFGDGTDQDRPQRH